MGTALSLGIAPVVAQLRELREQSLHHRKREDKPPRLPSRKALAAILEGLAAALFPNRLGQPDLTTEGIDTTWATRWTWPCTACSNRCGASCISPRA